MTARLVATPDLVLPEDAATSTFALLGMTGSGKSNGGVVMAEKFFDDGQPWVAIDPKGDWWGITLDREGTGPGLPVPVIGGQHGDVPLDPAAGKVLARLVAENRMTAIIDTSELDELVAVDFLVDFFSELYRVNRYPLHVFLEEASEYAPQSLPAEIKRMPVLVRKIARLVKMGRGHGLGFTLLDQRAAAVSKSVLSQVKTLVALLNTAPLDAKAVLDYLKARPEEPEVRRTLAELAPGDAWVYSPAYLAQRGQPALRRVHFARRETFDSGATPTDDGPPPDANRARLDLDALTSTLAQAVERAAEDDPDALRRRLELANVRVRELERELASIPVGVVHTGYPEDRVKDVLRTLGLGVQQSGEAVLDELDRAMDKVREMVRTQPGAVRGAMKLLDGTHPDQEHPVVRIADRVQVPESTFHDQPALRDELLDEMERDRRAVVGEKLPKAERAILTALAQHGPRTRQQLGILTGYSAGGGGFRNALGALRTKGYITSGDPSEITTGGMGALGSYEALPTGRALVEWWLTHGGLNKAEREILTVLTAPGVGRLVASREEIAERTASKYEPGGGGFRNAIGKLRTLGLIEGRPKMSASPELTERT